MEDLCECRINAEKEGNVEEDDRVDGPLFFTLTDPDVLICPICVHPLTVPVFQCQDGHIICSSCISRILRKKCPTCTQPIGKLRCRAIEKVIESIKVACKYRKYGCKEMLPFSNNLEHFNTCRYSVLNFQCPLPSCNFMGSYSDWLSHITRTQTTENLRHAFDVIDFSFDDYFYITLEKTQRFQILKSEEREEYGIFVLNNVSCAHGNAITVSRVAPAHCIGPCYDLTAEKYGEPSFESLSLHSSADCIQEKVNRQPAKKTLFVPDGFDLDGKLFLRARIKNPFVSCGNKHPE